MPYDLNEIRKKLLALGFTEEECLKWLEKPIKALNDETPMALIAQGNIKCILDLIAEWESGIGY